MYQTFFRYTIGVKRVGKDRSMKESGCSAICMQWSENGKCIWNSLYNCCDKPCEGVERFSNDRYINYSRREQE